MESVDAYFSAIDKLYEKPTIQDITNSSPPPARRSRSGKRWQPDEETQVLELLEAGTTVDTIAEQVQRTSLAITLRMGYIAANTSDSKVLALIPQSAISAYAEATQRNDADKAERMERKRQRMEAKLAKSSFPKIKKVPKAKKVPVEKVITKPKKVPAKKAKVAVKPIEKGGTFASRIAKVQAKPISSFTEGIDKAKSSISDISEYEDKQPPVEHMDTLAISADYLSGTLEDCVYAVDYIVNNSEDIKNPEELEMHIAEMLSYNTDALEKLKTLTKL